MLVTGAETLQGVDGERHVACWTGPDVDRIVLLCHDLREHAGTYGDVAAALVRSGAKVYALDQAGHGRSEGSPALIGDLDTAVDDQRLLLRLVLARHVGLPVVVVGQGTGGTLAVRLAQQCQDDLGALVLAGPLLGAGPGSHRDDPRLALDPPAARELSVDPAVGGRFLRDPLCWRGELPVSTAAALHRGLEAIERGPRLRLPVLWLHGEADTLVPAGPSGAALRRLVAPAALAEQVVAGARHQLLAGTVGAATVAAITGFLAAALHHPAVA